MGTGTGDIHRKVFKYMKNVCGVTSNTSLFLCVSGGVDSMALLHILMRIKASFNVGFNVSVVHFNHQRRSRKEAEREHDLVQFWSKIFYEIPFHYRELSDTEAKGNIAGGFQEFARNWRRSECLKIIQEQCLIDKQILSNDFALSQRLGQCQGKTQEREYCLTTGHHQDDQLEGVLLKLLRGTHLSRLTPMLPREFLVNGKVGQRVHQQAQPSESCASVSVLHPLLSVQKSELRNYMQQEHELVFDGNATNWKKVLESPHLLVSNESGVGTNDKVHRLVGKYTWSEDPSNTDIAYRRNEVRLDLMPVMARICGGTSNLSNRLGALSDQSWTLRQDIERDAQRYLSTALPSFPDSEQMSVTVKGTNAVLLQLPITHEFFALSKMARSEVVYTVLAEILRQQAASKIGTGVDSLRQDHVQRVLALCGEAHPTSKRAASDKHAVRLSGNVCVRYTSSNSMSPSLTSHVLEVFVEELSRHGHRQTDRQTDRQRHIINGDCER